MTYEMLVGDCAYSSWSLRGWLLFDAFGLPVRLRHVRMYSDDFAAALSDWPPARTVPVVRTPEGGLLADSLAIAEGLAEAHPQAGHWPAEPRARALARSITSEMHSGFTALRVACAMNLRVFWEGFAPDDALRADLARLETVWAAARALATDGPWLFGAYSAADAFYAPVAMRIAGYGLPVSTEARAYVDAHLGHAPLRRWRAMGEAQDRTLDVYDRGLPTAAFPMPAPIQARAVSHGPSVNAACPYSGRPPACFMEAGGRVWGFCNPFCRDKTVADPGAWPAFMDIYDS